MIREMLVVVCSAAIGPAPSVAYCSRVLLGLSILHLASVLLPRLAFDGLTADAWQQRMLCRLLIACFPAREGGTEDTPHVALPHPQHGESIVEEDLDTFLSKDDEQSLDALLRKGHTTLRKGRRASATMPPSASMPDLRRRSMSGLKSPPITTRARRSTSLFVMAPDELAVAIMRKKPIWHTLLVPSLTAIDVALAFSVAGAATSPEDIYVRGVANLCLGWRLVSPVASALAATGDDLVAHFGNSPDTPCDEVTGISMLPHAVILPRVGQAMLWLIWALVTAGSWGYDIRAAASSLGLSGILVGLAMQTYAADLIAGFTLLGDRRFALEDEIVFNGRLMRVRAVGPVATICEDHVTKHTQHVPNRLLSEAQLTNITQIRATAARPTVAIVHVACDTPADKLSELPQALHDAVFAALRATGSLADVTPHPRTPLAQLRSATDELGLRFELELRVCCPADDSTRFKRAETVALTAMIGALNERHIALGTLRMPFRPAVV